MKVELGFLNDFRCTYNSSLPICADELDTQIGTCKMTVENDKYVGDLCFDNANDINENFYLWCKWHIAENELLTVDMICLTKEVVNDDFSIRLKNAIAGYN